MPILDSDRERRLIAASRTFARLEAARRVILAAVAGSTVMARLRRASWLALPSPLGRYAVGVMLVTAATTHMLLAAATGHILAWTVLIIPAAALLIGLVAVGTSAGAFARSRE